MASMMAVSGPIYRKGGLTPFLGVVALLAGCATSLPKIEPEKLPEAPAQFKGELGHCLARRGAAAAGEWWKVFNDPVLDDLVERAKRAIPASRSLPHALRRRARWRASPMPTARCR